jgi:hypothetical protein
MINLGINVVAFPSIEDKLFQFISAAAGSLHAGAWFLTDVVSDVVYLLS